MFWIPYKLGHKMLSAGNIILTVLLFGWLRSLYAEDIVPALPIGESIETVSSFFIDKRFKTDPLGEGRGQYDSDPTIRLDAFDCTTFVETVWAIHRSKPKQDWKKTLQDLRYRNGLVQFTKRLHFISLDWVPYHEAAGRALDITAGLGLPLHESKTLIDRRAWYQKKHPQLLHDFIAEYPKESPQWVTVKYIKFGELLDSTAALASLRTELAKGAILANFVRPNFDTVESIGTHIDVSHQGFLLLKEGQIVLRHASLTLLKVGDEDFLEYMKFYRNHPTLKGMQLLRLL